MNKERIKEVLTIKSKITIETKRGIWEDSLKETTKKLKDIDRGSPKGT